MSLDAASINGLKVAELKVELGKRGLEIKGKKAELVARLTEAVEAESAAGAAAVVAPDVVEPAAEVYKEPTAAAAAEETSAVAAVKEPPVAAVEPPATTVAPAADEDAFEALKRKRAERFGVAYAAPVPTAKVRTKPSH